MRIYISILIFCFPQLLFATEWTPIGSVTIENDSPQQKAYADPKKSDQLIIYPACIVIQRAIEKVIFPNCHFRKKGENLKFDEKGRIRKKNGYLTGVVWGDAKTEISFFSTIFRRPNFKKNEVEVFDNGKWYTVSGLRSE
ncbi:MAG: hypothetical protein AB2734_01880 [Candidatus Thiodiazotropha endolucinida]